MTIHEANADPHISDPHISTKNPHNTDPHISTEKRTELSVSFSLPPSLRPSVKIQFIELLTQLKTIVLEQPVSM